VSYVINYECGSSLERETLATNQQIVSHLDCAQKFARSLLQQPAGCLFLGSGMLVTTEWDQAGECVGWK
jgi:hypothetical protein